MFWSNMAYKCLEPVNNLVFGSHFTCGHAEVSLFPLPNQPTLWVYFNRTKLRSQCLTATVPWPPCQWPPRPVLKAVKAIETLRNQHETTSPRRSCATSCALTPMPTSAKASRSSCDAEITMNFIMKPAEIPIYVPCLSYMLEQATYISLKGVLSTSII